MFYDYKCKKCKKIKKNIRHGMLEKPEIFCECGETMIKIITGGSGIHYKGMGWPRKGTGLHSKPKHGKEIGIKVDNDKRKAMLEAGEKV